MEVKMNKALIVLDVQKIYTESESEMYCEGAKKTVKNINALIESFDSKNQLIVLVRHIHKIDGSDLGHLFDFEGEPEDDFNFKEGSNEVEYDVNLKIPKNAKHLVKNRYSAFMNTNLNEILKAKKIGKVIICGFMTNFCCESTAREALDRDYYVDFIIDATGTPGTDNFDQKKIKEVVVEILSAGFSRVIKTKELINN
jgi:nicotinamidase-related amidase